jgi:hypothetical protein
MNLSIERNRFNTMGDTSTQVPFKVLRELYSPKRFSVSRSAMSDGEEMTPSNVPQPLKLSHASRSGI